MSILTKNYIFNMELCITTYKTYNMYVHCTTKLLMWDSITQYAIKRFLQNKFINSTFKLYFADTVQIVSKIGFNKNKEIAST